MSNYCTFYIVRHGETEWNVAKILQGHMDSPLTEKGLAQAKELALLFKDIPFDDFFASDVARAHRTAAIIALEHQAAVKTTQLLRERYCGRYEGMKVEKYVEELKDAIEAMARLTDHEQFKTKLAPDIESDEEIMSRFITFLREEALTHAGKNVLAVTHSGMMRSLLYHLGFGTMKDVSYESLIIHNLSYIKLDSDGTDFFIRETRGVEKVMS